MRFAGTLNIFELLESSVAYSKLVCHSKVIAKLQAIFASAGEREEQFDFMFSTIAIFLQ